MGQIQTFGKDGSKSEYPFTTLWKGTYVQIFGDTAYVAQQLRTLALNCKKRYSDTSLEEGITLVQWEKKAYILQPKEFSGDLEVHLMACTSTEYHPLQF